MTQLPSFAVEFLFLVLSHLIKFRSVVISKRTTNNTQHILSFKQFHYAEVDTLNQLITYGNKSIPYSDKIYDPLGLLFYLRDRDQSKIKDLVYDVYDSKRKIKIKFDVIDGKEIKFNNVNHRTFFLDPKSVDGKKLLKNDGHIRFWFSKEDRSPIQIQQTTNYGKIIMKLVNVDEE